MASKHAEPMGPEPGVERKASSVNDDATLALLGKKPVLRRRFSFFTMFGFAVCELITWETVLALFGQALANGGPSGAVYGFIISWFSTMSVYTVISELASLAPIAGGQYYWVYMLAPVKYKRITSYIVGWLTSLAWIATVATETLFAGTMIQGIMLMDNPDRDLKLWQGTLFTWAVILGCIFVNVVIPNWLPRFEIFILVFHIAGFFAILVTLLVVTPNLGTNASVWLTGSNGGGWPTQGVSYCVGFLGNVATFVGADASVHLAEEVSNAALNIPRAILGAMLVNGLVGLAMIVTILYCLGDPSKVLEPVTGFAFMDVFKNNIPNLAGATVMAAVVLCLTWACAIGITTTASRMTWSFARDRGFPFSRFLSKVYPGTAIPMNAVFVVTGLAALLTLIYVGSSVAFNDVVSLTITGFYGSYFLPSALLLYHRLKGSILPHGSEVDSASPAEVTNEVKHGHLQQETPKEPPSYEASPDQAVHTENVAVVNVRLVWGPWHVPGILGTINNIYACCYMVFVIFWSVWPPTAKVDASSMNYSVVVTGGVMILSTIWFFVRGKREYKGPLIDEEVASKMRAGSVVAVS
ncbi:amino acid transporter [Acrodontium crateriforme]|uniref:Amino acid transporter n=1 Tax=Acrodontium crateriforme TaxID=150365 RepID=A0AAQ3M0S9_9PEZI|nr:amino acid transporter [Acrodontium crateriforme]